MPDLFETQKKNLKPNAPLAVRMRPSNLEEFVGQTHMLGKDKLLRRATELNSADVVGFQAMIDLYNRHFPGQADELDNIYRAASDYTNNPDIWAQYAKFLEDRRDFRQAFIYWEAASFYRPDDRKLKENLERVSKILEAKQ